MPSTPSSLAPGILVRLEAEALALGIPVCLPLDPTELVEDPQVRAWCAVDRCGSFGKHPMCPPALDGRRDIHGRVAEARWGLLLQITEALEVRTDPEGVLRTKRAFHRQLLKLEARVANLGAVHPALARPYALIASTCALCSPCTGLTDCTFPDLARPSLEALGFDVMALLRARDLDTAFHPDCITWTGALVG